VHDEDPLAAGVCPATARIGSPSIDPYGMEVQVSVAEGAVGGAATSDALAGGTLAAMSVARR